MSLMQQNIATHTEALETAMDLEASLVGETRVAMHQIQAQLKRLNVILIIHPSTMVLFLGGTFICLLLILYDPT